MCATIAQRQGKYRRDEGENRRLPQVVRDCADHGAFSFLTCNRRALSAYLMSLMVGRPDSIKWAITGCARPPKRFRNSSINRRWVAPRVITASKIWALPLFFARRMAFFLSS